MQDWRAAIFRSNSALAGLIGLYASIVAQYGMHFSAAKLLSIEEYGQVAVALAITGIGGVLMQFGFSNAIVKYIGIYSEKRQWGLLTGAIKFAILLTFAGSTVVAAIGAISALNFISSGGYSAYVIATAFVALIPVSLLLLLQNVARGYKQMYLATLPAGVVVPAMCTGVLLFSQSSRTSEYFVAWYAGLSAAVVVLVLFNVLRIPEIANARNEKSRYAGREWLDSALPIMATVGLNQFLLRGNIVVLSLFVGPQITGVYALASRFAQVVTLANRAFNRFWSVDMAAAVAAEDSVRLNDVARTTARWTFALSSLFAVGLVLFGRFVFDFFGAEFSAAYSLMLVLIAGHMVTSFFAPSVSVLQMAGREKLALRIFFLVTSAVFAAYFVFVPVHGAFATAVITAIGVASIYLASAVLAKRVLSCSCAAIGVLPG